MATMEEIEEFSRSLVREFRPRKIILFGSYARGTATQDSDVDLFIILPFKGKPVFKSVEIRLKLRPPFPMDLIVRTPEKVQERLAMGDTFVQEVLEQGKILYDVDRS
jgi:uncharacterized protein